MFSSCAFSSNDVHTVKKVQTGPLMILYSCLWAWKSCYVYTVRGADPHLQPLLQQQVGSSHEATKAVCKFTMLFLSKANH